MASPPRPRDGDVDGWNALIRPVIGGSIPITFEQTSKDRVVATMIVDHRVHQPWGVLHGGASVVLAETVASMGAGLHCPDDMSVVGQEINANHIRAKRDGIVRAVGVPVHVGRTSQVWSVEIRDEQERLICVSRCTLAVVPLAR